MPDTPQRGRACASVQHGISVTARLARHDMALRCCCSLLLCLCSLFFARAFRHCKLCRVALRQSSIDKSVQVQQWCWSSRLLITEQVLGALTLCRAVVYSSLYERTLPVSPARSQCRCTSSIFWQVSVRIAYSLYAPCVQQGTLYGCSFSRLQRFSVGLLLCKYCRTNSTEVRLWSKQLLQQVCCDPGAASFLWVHNVCVPSEFSDEFSGQSPSDE